MAFDWNPYLLALFTGFGTVLSEGYRRFFTDEKEKDRVDLLQKKADLAITMSKNHLTIDDLTAAAGTIISDKREERTVSVTAKVEGESLMTAELRASKGFTQLEMNQQSAIDVRDADSEVESALIELRRFLSEDELEALERSQVAWMAFRQAQGDFAGSQWQGGSIQPLMINLEVVNVSKRRAIEIREIFKDVSRRRVPTSEVQS